MARARVAVSGFAASAQDLRRSLEQRGLGAPGILNAEERAYMTEQAYSELAGLDDYEDLFQMAKLRKDVVTYHSIKDRVVDQIADLEEYPQELFDLMCDLRTERDRKRAAELRTLTPEQVEALPPDKLWLKTILTDQVNRSAYLSQLELGCPYWQTRGDAERVQRSALANQAARAADQLAVGEMKKRGFGGKGPR